MFNKFVFKHFSDAICDPIKVIKLFIKSLAWFYGFILGFAGLFELFTDRPNPFLAYGIIGMIYVIILPIIIILLLFWNAWIISKDKKMKSWVRSLINIAVILMLLFSGSFIHYFERSCRIIIVSEAYLYSAEILDEKFREVYFGKPECLDSDCLEKFERDLPSDPLETLPRAVFKIPKRIAYGEYSIRIIYKREAYQDTLDKRIYLNSATDTLRINLERVPIN